MYEYRHVQSAHIAHFINIQHMELMAILEAMSIAKELRKSATSDWSTRRINKLDVIVFTDSFKSLERISKGQELKHVKLSTAVLQPIIGELIYNSHRLKDLGDVDLGSGRYYQNMGQVVQKENLEIIKKISILKAKTGEVSHKRSRIVEQEPDNTLVKPEVKVQAETKNEPKAAQVKDKEEAETETEDSGLKGKSEETSSSESEKGCSEIPDSNQKSLSEEQTTDSRGSNLDWLLL
ncbi:hypothetical protein QBC38DRAFT_448170 [Podospora fimiseda]|uniref:Uncharacterized protein n=1 Tax=Podospora fimiseda TaxID=252190 RepID=A0AAN7BFW1_9PEZI|nr:hypothetical protein QBC38DRAFT_448170 [Podospora fimiseda]